MMLGVTEGSELGASVGWVDGADGTVDGTYVGVSEGSKEGSNVDTDACVHTIKLPRKIIIKMKILPRYNDILNSVFSMNEYF